MTPHYKPTPSPHTTRQSPPDHNNFSPTAFHKHQQPTPPPISNETSFFLNQPITIDELLRALTSTNKKSSAGPDAINYDIILHTGHNTHLAILHIFNQSLTQGIIPDTWKLAEIISLPKTSHPTTPNHYRPISLLPCLGKTLEKILLLRLTHHLNSLQLHTPQQAGFTNHRSTTSQVLRVIQSAHSAWDSNNDLLFLSLDIHKAFDTVWHDGLLHKLQSRFRITGSIYNWLQNFLTNRQAYTKVPPSATSHTFPLQLSIAQGSVLAAFLFNTFISDLPHVIPLPTQSALFADDTNIFILLPRDPDATKPSPPSRQPSTPPSSRLAPGAYNSTPPNFK